MSIEKKSLISTLKTTKKANIVKEDFSFSGATASPIVKNATHRHAVVKAGTTRNAISKAATTRNAARKHATVRNLVKKG
jgi:hypothetical protein